MTQSTEATLHELAVRLAALESWRDDIERELDSAFIDAPTIAGPDADEDAYQEGADDGGA